MGTLNTTATMILGSSFGATCYDPLGKWLTNGSVLGPEDKREDEDDLKRKWPSDPPYVGQA